MKTTIGKIQKDYESAMEYLEMKKALANLNKIRERGTLVSIEIVPQSKKNDLFMLEPEEKNKDLANSIIQLLVEALEKRMIKMREKLNI